MILGKVRCGFFQELVLHRQFPRFAFKLPKPGPLTHAQRWLVTGMLTPISIDPVPQSALIDTELLGHLSDRTRCLDHQFHGLFPILGREVPLRTRQDCSFPDGPILVGSLSGKSGAPQLSRYDLGPVWMMWALAWGIHGGAVVVVFGVLGRRKVLLTWDDADCLDLQVLGKEHPRGEQYKQSWTWYGSRAGMVAGPVGRGGWRGDCGFGGDRVAAAAGGSGRVDHGPVGCVGQGGFHPVAGSGSGVDRRCLRVGRGSVVPE